MATTITRYTSYNQYIHSGEINLNDTGNIYLALVTSAYTFSAAHSIWASASGSEVANGAGYTTNGAALGTLSVNATRFTAANVTWTALTKTFRGGVLYHRATYLTIVNPLIAYILFDSTPADIVMAGGDFAVQWNASGIITFA